MMIFNFIVICLVNFLICDAFVGKQLSYLMKTDHNKIGVSVRSWFILNKMRDNLRAVDCPASANFNLYHTFGRVSFGVFASSEES